VAGTLGLSPQNLEVRKPLNKLGLDSMMALSLTNWLQAELGVDVPVVRILKGHSVVDLTDLILDGLGVEAPGPAQPPTKASDLDEAEARRWLSRIDELTEDEVDSLLRAAKRK
jgi:acyl carrier protein